MNNYETNYPLVSVVMCTFNADKYLSDAILSVLAQTYTNFEFIIWDDGSTDRTKEIIKSFKDNRIHYFYHENTGLGMALNLACTKANGKYIARMDSDDICLPDRLKTEVTFLENHEDHVLVSSAVFNIDECGCIIKRTFPCTNNRVLKLILCKHHNPICHPMVMIRKDAYDKVGGYPPIRKSQDYLLWSRLAKQGKFSNIPSPLGKYRITYASLDHYPNSYKKVLLELLLKMANDEVLKKTDIDLYNHIYLYSKDDRKVKHEHMNKKSINIQLTNLFCFKICERKIELLISWIKNIYYYIKLIAR